MSLIDSPAAALPRPTVSRSALRPWIAAAALLLLMGLPALMAPQSTVAPELWHGNVAGHTAVRP